MNNNESFPAWPFFAEDEIEAAANVLRSGQVNYWTGDQIKQFEHDFADFIGVKHAIAVANGTLALELAIRSLDIGHDDEVIVPCRTFIATASAVVACGATPVVADVDPYSQNITVETIQQQLTDKTKAIIVVHLAGWPCDMDSIMMFAKENHLLVIEDCAQAHGATFNNKPVGSFGDISAFSFCQDKIMTTGGEGGMVTTNNETLWKKAWSYKDHGKNINKLQAQHENTSFRWLHDDFGSNWRMTEMQAAIGRLQLKKLPHWLDVRRCFASIYNKQLSSIPGLHVVTPPDNIEHSYYKYYVFVKPQQLREDWSRDRILQSLATKGVPAYSGICPEIHREQAFTDLNGRPAKSLPQARTLGENSMMLLLHPTLTQDHIHNFCNAIKDTMAEAVGASSEIKPISNTL